MKNSFVLYHDWEEPVKLLTDAQAGALFKAIFAYEKRGEEPPEDPAVRMAFRFIRTALDENRVKYEPGRGRTGRTACWADGPETQWVLGKAAKADTEPASVSDSVSAPF